MRIIAGKYKGRRIEISAKTKNLRPTSDFARQAIFNILMHSDVLGDKDFLDLSFADICSGSGAFGLEAISRGAKKTTFLDSSLEHLKITKAHLEKWGGENSVSFITSDAAKLPGSATSYDVIFIDPPYKSGLLKVLLPMLKSKGWSNNGSVIITECDKDEEIIPPKDVELYDKRSYGRAVITIFIQR